MKRVESVVLFRSVANLALRNDPSLKKAVMIHKAPITSYPQFIYLNRVHKKLVPRIERSLSSLKESGVYQEIARKHLVVPAI